MAFYTTSDIQSGLPSGFDSSLVDRLLVMAEATLASKDILFSAISLATRVFEPSTDGNFQKIFKANYLSEISGISILENSALTALTNDEYTLNEYQNLDQYYNSIILTKKEISYPTSLSVTAKFGLYIDKNDSNNLTSKLLKSCLIEFIRNQINIKKYIGQGAISSSSEAGSSISFDTHSFDTSRTIVESPDFKTFFDYIS